MNDPPPPHPPPNRNHERVQVAAPHRREEGGPAAAAAVAQPEVPLIPEEHRIESVDRWLELNGLPPPPNNGGDGNDDERWERVQDRTRVAEEEAYARSVHDRVFSATDKQAALETQRKAQQLQAWHGRKLRITCRQQQEQHRDHNETISCSVVVDLVPLAECCDLIFALASTWHHFNPHDDNNNDNDNSTDENMQDNSNPKKMKDVPLELNLPEYSLSAVQAFLDIVHHRKYLNNLADDDLIVELCHLAHYLQHAMLLEELVQILLTSIDTANCMAMTELADQLHLPRLFEAALSHMMQSVHNLEEGECWDHLTPELKQRIGAIQSAIQSSIHDQRSALYFGSLQEYLGKSKCCIHRSDNDDS